MAAIIKLRKAPVTGPAVTAGTGTGFTYDAALQAGKATVDGQEVLAPKRSGNGIQAQVVPRTNTLQNLLATVGNAGELSYPSDAPGIVQHSGVPGVAGKWLANEAAIVINVNSSSRVYYDDAQGVVFINIPSGVRNIILTTGGFTNRVTARQSTVWVMLVDGADGAPAKYSIYLSFDVQLEISSNRFNVLYFGTLANAKDLRLGLSLGGNAYDWNYAEFWCDADGLNIANMKRDIIQRDTGSWL